MKLFFVFVLATPLFGQHAAVVSLAPIRAQARQAFTAEMDHPASGDCKTLVSSAPLEDCFQAALAQSNANLKTFRAAIEKSIRARQNLFAPQFLEHVESSEHVWDLYRAKQAQVTMDMVDNPADQSSSAAATEIDLIQSHMRDLDKAYYILLHDDCGACLVDQ